MKAIGLPARVSGSLAGSTRMFCRQITVEKDHHMGSQLTELNELFEGNKRLDDQPGKKRRGTV